MLKVAPNIWVGSQADFAKLDEFGTEWAILHACKEPHHRAYVGYKGQSAPEGPEKLWARRDKRLALNMVDAPDPKYFPKVMVDAGLAFIDEQVPLLEGSDQLLIACNRGESRAPTMGMLWLAPSLPEEFEAAETEYLRLCPAYKPGLGMREFARIHWRWYRNRKAAAEPQTGDEPDLAIDKATALLAAFGADLKDAPDRAVSNLISSIALALKDAGAKPERPAPTRMEID